MKKNFVKEIIIAILALFFLIPGTIFAHEPRIPDGNQTRVDNPEISKAYYSELQNTTQTYTISSDVPFALYVNILVPDISGQKKDISAKIIKNGITEKPFVILDGNGFAWMKFFEPFGYDSYWKGPEYRANVQAGKYDIIVSSSSTEGKYSLAIGETELFDFREIYNALNLVPKIKRDFFNESPITFIFSLFGWGFIVVMFILAFIFGFIYRFLLKKFTKNSMHKTSKNIGQQDRFIRIAIGIFLLIWAITTSWNPVLLFFSGFAFFEAIFSWCGFYALFGTNTCPRDFSNEPM